MCWSLKQTFSKTNLLPNEQNKTRKKTSHSFCCVCKAHHDLSQVINTMWPGVAEGHWERSSQFSRTLSKKFWGTQRPDFCVVLFWSWAITNNAPYLYAYQSCQGSIVQQFQNAWLGRLYPEEPSSSLVFLSNKISGNALDGRNHSNARHLLITQRFVEFEPVSS